MKVECRQKIVFHPHLVAGVRHGHVVHEVNAQRELEAAEAAGEVAELLVAVPDVDVEATLGGGRIRTGEESVQQSRSGTQFEFWHFDLHIESENGA